MRLRRRIGRSSRAAASAGALVCVALLAAFATAAAPAAPAAIAVTFDQPALTGLEGSPVTANGSFGDPAAQTWTATVDYGDGSGVQPLLLVGTSFSLDHTYAAAGTYTIRVVVTGVDGTSGTGTLPVTIANAPPTATLVAAPSRAPEGAFVTVALTDQRDTSEADTAAGFRYAFSCAGAPLDEFTYATAPNGKSSFAICRFDDDGIRTVSARIFDVRDGSSVYFDSIVVDSVAPTGRLTVQTPVPEDLAAKVTVSNQLDPSGADNRAGFHYAFACDGASLADATYASAGTSPTSSCTFDGPSTPTVRARIIDKDDAFTELSAAAVVANVAPTGQLGNAGPVDEGTPVVVSYANATDPSAADVAAGLHFVFACDGGSLAGTTYATSGSSPATACTFDDGPSTHVVRARVIDKDDGFAEATTDVLVTNAAPTARFETPSRVGEGAAFELALRDAADASAADAAAGFEYAFDCGDGAGLGPFSRAVSSSCPTADDGTRTVRAEIRDRDGGATTYVATVEVANLPPSASFHAPADVTEGDSFRLSLTDAADPSSADTAAAFRYAFDCGSGYGALSAAASATCTAVDDPGVSVRGKIVDKDGGVAEYTAQLAVGNAPPVVKIAAPAPGTFVQVGTQVAFAGAFADAGRADRHSAVWSFDSLTTPGTVTETGGSGTAAATFMFTSAGVYSVRLAVSDEDGGTGAATTIAGREMLVVVFDPNAGSVTGEGELRSPPGAFAARPGAAGKASFELSARYPHGSVVPRGEVELEFEPAHLEFRSTALEWLVVSGDRAQLSALGAVGRVPGYRLLVTAYDRPDRVRLKLTDPSGAVVYDNVRGASDDLDLAAPQLLRDGKVSIRP